MFFARAALLVFAFAAGAQTLRPIEVLRAEALRATPPLEKRDFRTPDLVDLTAVGAGFRFDIRYATVENFLGVALYTEPRAFLQRPAADALVRAATRLRQQGFGLLIYDAYRPWFVTKMFREAAPPELRRFLADPAKGSKHNRGCAVDLALYDLRTNEPIPMPSGFDEMTARAHPGYRGGTAGERANRDKLRLAMEREGFSVNPGEWWHFDYKDWAHYPILNVPFNQIRAVPAASR